MRQIVISRVFLFFLRDLELDYALIDNN